MRGELTGGTGAHDPHSSPSCCCLQATAPLNHALSYVFPLPRTNGFHESTGRRWFGKRLFFPRTLLQGVFGVFHSPLVLLYLSGMCIPSINQCAGPLMGDDVRPCWAPCTLRPKACCQVGLVRRTHATVLIIHITYIHGWHKST